MRLVSLPAAFLVLHKQMNQYNDVKCAKYWRDRDGNRHKVQPGDGHSKAGTVTSRRKRSDDEVKMIKKRDTEIATKKRSADSYKRFVRQVEKGK